jgi:hypothetical protein
MLMLRLHCFKSLTLSPPPNSHTLSPPHGLTHA